MSSENNKENNEKTQENVQNQQPKEPVFPELTLDILVGVRQLLALSLQRKTFTEEEMKTVGGVFNYFAASVEGLVHNFAQKNPEAVKKMMESFEQEAGQDKQEDKKGLETIQEENPLPSDIKNGCDGDDIQG